MIYEHMTYECIVLLCIYMHRESRSDSEVDTIVKLIWPKAGTLLKRSHQERSVEGGRGEEGRGKKNVEFLFHSKTKVYKQLLNFHQAPFLSCYLISAIKKHYSRKCFNLIFTFRCRSATFLNYQILSKNNIMLSGRMR